MSSKKIQRECLHPTTTKRSPEHYCSATDIDIQYVLDSTLCSMFYSTRYMCCVCSTGSAVSAAHMCGSLSVALSSTSPLVVSVTGDRGRTLHH